MALIPGEPVAIDASPRASRPVVSLPRLTGLCMDFLPVRLLQTRRHALEFRNDNPPVLQAEVQAARQ
jgi:hypothetical protein